MKLNEFELVSYQRNDNNVTFVLAGEVLSDAAGLDGQILTITDAEQEVAVFSGYSVIGVYLEFGNTVVECMRALDEETANAISSLSDEISILADKIDSAEQTVTTIEDKVNDVAEASNPDVVAFAKMAVPAMTADMTTTEALSIVSLLPRWKVGAHYSLHEAFVHENKVYRAAQEIPEAQEIYKPGDVGTESLYTLIELAEDGVRVWKKPTDATNSFALGERAHYPTGTDSIYVSKRDGNDSEPTKDEWWELEEASE